MKPIMRTLARFDGLTWWKIDYRSISFALYRWSPVLVLAVAALLPTKVMTKAGVSFGLSILGLGAVARILQDAVGVLNMPPPWSRL
jgi:hypothetical protein